MIMREFKELSVAATKVALAKNKMIGKTKNK